MSLLCIVDPITELSCFSPLQQHNENGALSGGTSIVIGQQAANSNLTIVQGLENGAPVGGPSTANISPDHLQQMNSGRSNSNSGVSIVGSGSASTSGSIDGSASLGPSSSEGHNSTHISCATANDINANIGASGSGNGCNINSGHGYLNTNPGGNLHSFYQSTKPSVMTNTHHIHSHAHARVHAHAHAHAHHVMHHTTAHLGNGLMTPLSPSRLNLNNSFSSSVGAIYPSIHHSALPISDSYRYIIIIDFHNINIKIIEKNILSTLKQCNFFNDKFFAFASIYNGRHSFISTT